MMEIKLYKTTFTGLKSIGICMAFVVMGLWMIKNYPNDTFEYILGWVGTCIFGLGFLVGLFRTFDRRPQIIISKSGIWNRRTNQDEVKWEQITDAYPLDILEQKFISLEADDTSVFKMKPSKAAKINKESGAQNLYLNLEQLNIDEIELTRFINQLRKENIEERSKLIRTFKIKETHYPFPIFRKPLVTF